MITTGIIRRIDDLGRIVIPKEIRRRLNIREGDPLELYLSDEGITFKPYYTGIQDEVSALLQKIKKDDYMDPEKRKRTVEILKKTAEELDKVQKVEEE